MSVLVPGMTEVPVKQPPKVGPKMSPALRKQRKAAKAGERMDKRRVRFHKEQMLAGRKAARVRVKALRKEERRLKAGGRMNKRRLAYHNLEAAAVGRQGRAATQINRGAVKAHKVQLRDIRGQIAGNRAIVRQANRHVKQMKRAQKAKLKAANPRTRRQKAAKEHKLNMKAANMLWVIRKLKRLFKKRKGVGDGRNHGAKGVVSGSRGRTGFAGRRAGR
jgi:hypothetical protein